MAHAAHRIGDGKARAMQGAQGAGIVKLQRGRARKAARRIPMAQYPRAGMGRGIMRSSRKSNRSFSRLVTFSTCTPAPERRNADCAEQVNSAPARRIIRVIVPEGL